MKNNYRGIVGCNPSSLSTSRRILNHLDNQSLEVTPLKSTEKRLVVVMGIVTWLAFFIVTIY